MGDRVAATSPLLFNFVSYQSDFERGIALKIERFVISLSQSRIENEFGRAARVAHALGLSERHVVAHTVFGLASGETLQERGAAIFEAVENGTVQLGSVGD